MAMNPTLAQIENFIPVVNYCNTYKGILQEHCRKFGICDPMYVVATVGDVAQTPKFTCKVTINKVVFKSEGMFHNSKEAEQNAARVALYEIYKAEDKSPNLPALVHESGLCKSMLQEYAVRARLPLPVYEYKLNQCEGMMPLFGCTVNVGGHSYPGLAARTKKAAAKNAAIVACATIMATLSALLASNDVVVGAHY